MFLWVQASHLSVSSAAFNAYFSKPMQGTSELPLYSGGPRGLGADFDIKRVCLGEGMCGKLSPPGIYLQRWGGPKGEGRGLCHGRLGRDAGRHEPVLKVQHHMTGENEGSPKYLFEAIKIMHFDNGNIGSIHLFFQTSKQAKNPCIVEVV